MLSQHLTRLAAVFAPYEGTGCELNIGGVQHLMNLLLDGAAEARQLEQQAAPDPARPKVEDFARSCNIAPVSSEGEGRNPPPPWGYGPSFDGAQDDGGAA